NHNFWKFLAFFFDQKDSQRSLFCKNISVNSWASRLSKEYLHFLTSTKSLLPHLKTGMNLKNIVDGSP
ncbi:MAG: hypothetical protein LBF22_05475, partial [Deltaproteobacteria bacterium]|nr:hypothetical protein [Deltaproteobacteria bacterium]